MVISRLQDVSGLPASCRLLWLSLFCWPHVTVPACAVCFRLCFDNMTYYFTIYLCLCWVLIAARGLPLVVVSEDSSPAVVVRLVVEPGLQAHGLQSLQYGGLAAP